MKLKCPACQAVLNVADSAAGKVVKCTCGKQLRAPSPKPAGAPSAVPAARPAASRQAVSSGFDPDLFDELTDQDLQPIAMAGAPSTTAAGPAAGAMSGPGSRLLQQYASGDVRDRGDAVKKGARPGLLTFLGVVNVFWTLIYFGLALVLVGLVSFIPALAEELPEGGGLFMVLAVAALVVMGLLSLVTVIACFVNKPIFWYFMLFSYAYGFADRVLGAVGRIVNEEPAGRIGGAVAGVVIGLGFWIFMHSDEVKSYYGTQKASLAGALIPDALGLALGLGLSAAVVFMQ